MFIRKSVYSGAVVQTLHFEEVFKAANSFSPGELPTNRQVIERMLTFLNFGTLSATRKVVHELHDRWVLNFK